MLFKLEFLLAFSMTIFFIACSETDFNGQSAKGVVTDTSSTPDKAAPKDSLVVDDGGKIDLAQRCWFAVSGTWIGHSSYLGQYQDRFPSTTSGRPVSHGESFDNTGGVFLSARDQPYIYGQGGREIDKAFDTTFDSIVIAPGMTAELRNASGTVVFKGDGPVVVTSSYYENQPQFRGQYFTAIKNRNDLPEWIKTYLAGRTALLDVDLHAASWVKVSAVAGGSCEVK